MASYLLTAFKHIMWLCIGLSVGSATTYSIIEWQKQPAYTYVGAADLTPDPKPPKAKAVTQADKGKEIIEKIMKTPTMQEFLPWVKSKHYEYAIYTDLKSDPAGLPDSLQMKKVKWPAWLVKVNYVVANKKTGEKKENLIHMFYVEQESGKIVRER